jgi:hypothetical protein
MPSFRNLRLLALTLSAFVAAAPVRAVEPDKLLPDDAEAVLVVNVRQILDSPLVKKHALEQVKAALQMDAQLKQLLAASGVDPLKDVDSLTLSTAGGTSGKVLMVVRGKFDLDKVKTAADDFAKKHPGKLKITEEGKTRLYEGEADGKPVFAAFIDGTTLVASSAKDFTLETVKNAGTKAPKVSKEMQAALGNVTGKESLYLAVIVTEELKKLLAANPQTKEIGPKLENLTGGLKLTDALEANVQIQTADAKTAASVKKLVDAGKGILTVFAMSDEKIGPVVNEIVKALKITNEKTNVNISLKVTEEMIQKAAPKQDK